MFAWKPGTSEWMDVVSRSSQERRGFERLLARGWRDMRNCLQHNEAEAEMRLPIRVAPI